MRPLAALFWSSLILPLASLAAWGWYSYEHTLENAAERAERTAAVLREHALRVLEAQETAIKWIDVRLEGMSWEEIRVSRRIHNILKQIREDSSHIDGIWLVPPNGFTANSADFFPMPPVSTLNRDYYHALKKSDETYLGEMIEGKLKGNLNFNISRRRTSSDGSFDGLILVTVSFSYLEAFWDKASGDNGQVVSIVRSDGSILVRYPALNQLAGRIPVHSPFFALSAATDTGSYEDRSEADGRERLYSFAKLGSFPAYMIVGHDRQSVLAPWKQELLFVGIFAAVVTLALTTVVRLAQRREERLTAEVERRRTAESSLMEKSEHISAMERAEEALRKSEERLRAALEASRMGTFRWDFRTKTVEYDESMLRLFGLSEDDAPRSFGEFISLVDPDDRRRVRNALQEGTRAGENMEIEFRVVCPDGRRVWLYQRSLTRLDTSGRPQYLTGACIDLTARKEAEQRQKLISAELDHRVRNTLASIQSILGLTQRSAATKEEFTQAVSGRVQAMARAHGHLTRSGWRGAYLKALVSDELAPYAGEEGSRATVNGPDLLLLPSAAVSMALVIHELTTNAVKHGALSIPEGNVVVTWQVFGHGSERMLSFEWTELNGPSVARPERAGFGSTMLNRVLKHEFDAAIQMEFRSEGFRFAANFAVSRIVARESPRPDAEEQVEALPPSTGGTAANARVLLVEDEVVLALGMAEMLEELGAVVAGPFSRLNAAIRAALDEEIDAALLDINLAGKRVFPLADILVEQGVPFAFVSGYERKFLPERFRDRMLLQKPVSSAALSEALRQLLAAQPLPTSPIPARIEAGS